MNANSLSQWPDGAVFSPPPTPLLLLDAAVAQKWRIFDVVVVDPAASTGVQFSLPFIMQVLGLSHASWKLLS